MPVDDTSGYQTCANCGLETGFEETRTQSASDETSSPPIDLNEAASRITSCARCVCLRTSDSGPRRLAVNVPEHPPIPEKNVPVVADFAKQMQEWALRFRDSSHLGGEMRDRTLRKTQQNRQDDTSLRSPRTRPSAFFAVELR